MSIAVKSSVAIIAGVNQSLINNLFLTMADNFVKLILTRSFDAIATDTYYIDLRMNNDYLTAYDGVREFVLPKTPVNTVTSVTYMPDETAPTILTLGKEYFANLQQGTISLADIFSPAVGQRILKVIYTYGYSTAPADVIDFANYYAAFLYESNKIATNDAGAPLAEVEIGRYREKYATTDVALKGKYTTFLKQMEDLLIQKYKVWE